MKKLTVVFIVFIITALYAVTVYAAQGASLTVGPTTTAAATTPGNATAEGGNITEVNISVTSQTSVWQGFYGEVTGAITLEDSAGNVLFRFNQTGLAGTGEVYASRNSAVTFGSIATSMNFCTVDELLTGTGSDRVNSTFTNNTNPSFLVGAINITATSSCATNTFNSTGANIHYDEIILNDTTSTIPVYATLIETSEVGFNGQNNDYQLIVPENLTSATTLYFFYAELD